MIILFIATFIHRRSAATAAIAPAVVVLLCYLLL